MLSRDEAIIRVREVSVSEAANVLSQGFISAVGHESTAQLLTQLLSIPVPVNRIQIRLEPGDKLVVFQLLTRLPEGKVLTLEELKTIQYKLYLVVIVQ